MPHAVARRAKRGGTIIGATLATGTEHGSGPSPCKSPAVKTPSTPGMASAAVVSIPSIAACACGDRTTYIQACPGTPMSSMNRARPVRKRKSSKRRSDRPRNDMSRGSSPHPHNPN